MSRAYFLNPGEVPILGVSGRAGSGKDFMADLAVERLGFLKVPLANHFKVEAAAVGALQGDSSFFNALWCGGPKPDELRELLQLTGTEHGRDVHGEDVWVAHAEAWIGYFARQSGVRGFIVPDIRFPNELSWVHALGGRVYRLVGRGGLDGARSEHRSEVALDGLEHAFDRVIDNTVGYENDAVGVMLASLQHYFPDHYRGTV